VDCSSNEDLIFGCDHGIPQIGITTKEVGAAIKSAQIDWNVRQSSTAAFLLWKQTHENAIRSYSRVPWFSNVGDG